ncbi:hypothetical protein Zmor_004469 [Zophobas morio]|jgi:hypothetical protein|uniref:Uncharacterized protein n=1 Tax=Zophobas morio TaxID=2755281 RepID=A0AA38HKB5_9CUCU|nr:hypothetical protein Zmor_004469 [Zophobas morio]
MYKYQNEEEKATVVIIQEAIRAYHNEIASRSAAKVVCVWLSRIVDFLSRLLTQVVASRRAAFLLHPLSLLRSGEQADCLDTLSPKHELLDLLEKHNISAGTPHQLDFRIIEALGCQNRPHALHFKKMAKFGV